MQVSFTPAEIVEMAQPCELRGSTTEQISGVSALATAAPGDLTFLGNPKYKVEVKLTKASVVLLPTAYKGEPQPNQLFVIVEKPSAVLSRVCSRIEQLLWPRPPAGIHPLASIAAGARVATSATIGPWCIVEDGAVIG